METKIQMRSILLAVFISSGLCAQSSPLFGRVIDIAKHDTLNVRSQPDYRSQKVAKLPLDAYVGVEKCKKVVSSTWCRVYPLVQQWYEHFGSESHKGWVNARYLAFINRGYVIAKGKKNCDYALKCHEGKCEVVYGYDIDNEHKITTLKTQWIAREHLKGESHFGAMTDNEDGYCNSRIFIEEYFKINPIRKKE